jgi:nucleotide-binding universal stress UspA family protein
MTRIVVGVDGSDESRTALRWAANEARIRGAELEVVYVYDDTPAHERYANPYGFVSVPPSDDIERQRASSHAQGLVERMAAEPEVSRDVEVLALAIQDRRPARALVEHAKDADLLVVGSRGRGGFGGLVLGSVSQQCAHHASCPLTIVPTPARDGLAA